MQSPVEIRRDDLTSPEVFRFLQKHLQNMAQHSPPDSVHALDVESLRRPDVTFWSVWRNMQLAGCGAIMELDARHGEIKSMYTTTTHLRTGVATRLMRHMLEESERRAYQRLSLETGSMEAFAPARSFYTSFGFRICEPFGDYIADPHSVFMTREL